ncbi:PaaI family thioesterase [Rhodopirellula islandica]|uniref:PaaI family thioesterase n=1 Tax=Rhodopirellula islandica TaxID=595434 RepID=UPI000649CAFD|nr:PaaI family thioesterase [Rhodopirellula islandica]
MSERFSDAPISRLVGFQVHPSECVDGDPDAGTATVDIQCGPQHHNPMGRVHGGLVSALADAAMGIAFGRTLLSSEDFSTIEMKVSFIRPVREGLLSAKATVIQRGLRIGFVECQITNEKGKLVATASSTCTVLAGG